MDLFEKNMSALEKKNKEYADEIKDMWDTHWLTNMGVKHKQLENYDR